MIEPGQITRGMFLGTAEIVAEFDDPGNAAAASANLNVFLKWALGGSTRPPPAAVILIVTQSRLDPVDDRPRKVDWPKPPEVRMEGVTVSVDAPRSKSARDTIRKVLDNSRPTKVYDRRRLPTAAEKTRVVRLIAIGAVAAALLLGGVVVAILHWMRT